MNYQKQFQKFQEEFLSAVRLHPEENFLDHFKDHPFRSRLSDPIFFRFKAYNTSYYARLCNVMADHLFDAARDLIGSEALYDLLLEYYVSIPANELDMMDTARGFPEFLKKQKSDVLVKYPFLSDLCQLSIQYWDLIFAEDDARNAIKESDLSSLDPAGIFLTRSHVYFRSEYPIFDIWNSESGDKVDTTGQGILILKTDGIDFDSVDVPKPFFHFMEKLSKGCSLDESIESGFEDEDELDILAFQKWIAQLVQKGALRLA